VIEEREHKSNSLGTTGGASNVKGDNLSADEVVARGDVGRDLEVDLAAVGVHVLSTPVLRVAKKERESEQRVQLQTGDLTHSTMRPVWLTLNQFSVQGVEVVRSATLAM
jgi:hypothetical protein